MEDLFKFFTSIITIGTDPWEWESDFPCGDPYGDPHKNPVGMGIEIKLPRQPWYPLHMACEVYITKDQLGTV